MKKHQSKVGAAIDIGSSGVRMHIAQWDGKNMLPLDKLQRNINLGQEVFTTGYISFDTVRELSSILDGFCALAREYKIMRIHATATTALREAVNRSYVLDHLSIQNNLDVHVLEDAEVNAILFNSMENEFCPKEGKALMVYGGTGTINFALHKDKKAVFSQNMHTGLLKISEMLRETAEYSQHIDRVADEYLQTYLFRSDKMGVLPDLKEIVFSSGDIQPLFALCKVKSKNNTAVLHKKMLMAIYEEYRQLTFDQISSRLGLNLQQSGVLYAALAFLIALLRISNVEKIHCTQINLADALLDLYLRPGARRAFNESIRQGAIASALDLCDRYHCNRKHAEHAMNLALMLYEKLRKVHGLSRRQSLLLQLACILHESGHYTNAADLQEASFDLVKDAQIYGLCARETLLAANIIAPQSLLGIERGAPRSTTLTEEEVLFVAKMHAILHIADALDYSRRQKAKLCGVELEDNALILKMKVSEDYTLEQWMFRQSASLFQEVFGLIPQLEIESTYKMRGNH